MLLLVGVLSWRRENRIKKRLLFWIGSITVVEYFATNRALLTDLLRNTNAPLFHVAVPVYAVLLIGIYHEHLQRHIPISGIIAICFAIVAGSIVNAVLIVGLFEFPTLAMGLYALLGILLPLSYLYYLLQSLAVSRLDEDPLFVLSAGFLIYFSGNFLLWAFFNLVTINNEVFLSVYSVNGVLTALLGFFLLTTLLMNKKTAVRPET